MVRLSNLLLSLTIGLAFVVLSLSAPASADDVLPDKVTFKASYFDRDFKPLDDATLPSTVLFRITLIPGNIFGQANTSALFEFPLRIDEPKILDLAEVRPIIERLAAPLTNQGADAGLVVTPQDTKFARFAAVVAYPGTDKGVGRASFRGSLPNETLLMVYFDGPCKISGIVHGRTATITYNANIAHRGVHLLSLVRDSASSAHVTIAALPLQLVFSIVPRP